MRWVILGWAHHSGAIYGYCREAVPGASFLKLGLTYPLQEAHRRLPLQGREALVVEELTPSLRSHPPHGYRDRRGKELNTLQGELNARLVAASLAKAGSGGRRRIVGRTRP